MRAHPIALLLAGTLLCAPAAAAQAGQGTPLRVIAFGAHPDDNELKAAGVAALWAAQGHKVKFVSMTNGDVGHFGSAGGPLATRRRAEVEACAAQLGIETEVLDIHDGELEPTLENRKTVARLIRDWQADVVLTHRPYDYHADHRYSGVLVNDAAVLVVAPFFTPDTPPVRRNPVILYYSDGFRKPYPFEPTIVVGIDAAAEKKWSCISAMPSQFGDADSWQARTRANVPAGEQERRAFLLESVKARSADTARQYRDRLVELYGAERAGRIQYAEAFELSEYGGQASAEELKRLFPTSP